MRLQKVLKINIQMKPEFFLLGLMDNQLENTYGQLVLPIITAARLLLAQTWQNSKIATMGE